MDTKLIETMNEVSSEIDAIKVELAKSNEKKLKGTTFNCAALRRARKHLLNLEKIGFKFRRDSVSYEKSLKTDS